MNFSKKFAILLVAIFSLGLSQTAFGAFGISPPFVHATHMVPGAVYHQTIWLVQNQPDEDLHVKANFDLPDKIKDWVTLDTGIDFIIPKGTRQFPVELNIAVPKSASLAIYNGNLTFAGAPSQTGQVTIALGAQVSISLVVGNDIYRKVTVPVVDLLDIEEGWDPRVYVKFQNDGNVPEKFDGATYELLDQYGATRLAYGQKSKDFPETEPFTVKEYTIDFPVSFKLGTGQYWGKVDFYQEEKLIASQKTVFNVLPAGSLSSPYAKAMQLIKDRWPIGVGALLVLTGGIWSFRLFRRKRRA